MSRRLLPVALCAALLLTGCQWDTVEAACRRILAAARTSTDSVLALSAKPSDSYMSCAAGMPDTTRAVVEDTTGGRR